MNEEELGKAYSDTWQQLADRLKDGAEAAEIAPLAARLAPLFIARVNPLHAAMRGMGLPAPTLEEAATALVEANQKFARLGFRDPAGQRDVTADFAVNGNAFHGGRRYEALATRIDLSDAEIARTGVLRVESTGGAIVITLLTFDGRPAKLKVDPAAPLAPQLEGKVPDAALALFRNRPNEAGLGALVASAAEAARKRGAGKGFFGRLFDGVARQAAADLAVLEGYLHGGAEVAAEEEKWRQQPQVLRQVAQAALRQLSGGSEGQEMVIRLLVVVAIGQVLSGLGT